MRRGGLSLGLVLLLGCERDRTPADDVELETCGMTKPTLLVAAPSGVLEPDFAPYLGVWLAGDDLFYSWGPQPLSTAPIYLLDRCGGEPRLHDREAFDVWWQIPRTTASGPRLYHVDRATSVLSLRDRVDVDGEDEPIALGEFVDQQVHPIDAGAHTLFVTFADDSPRSIPASGVGGRIQTVWTHSGDPGDPLVRLADAVNLDEYPGALEWPLVLLDDVGAARLIDLDTGEDRVVVEGARAVDHDRPRGRLVWQQRDDDGDESVHLRDLATGADLPLTTLDFDPLAPEPRRWRWSDDGGHVALVGAADTLAAVWRTDDGAPVATPPHVRARGAYPGGFWLTLVDDERERVDALWDPHTGELSEFHRSGADRYPIKLLRADEVVEYIEYADDRADGELWSVDLARGASERKLPRIGLEMEQLADGRILTILRSSPVRHELALIDPDRGKYHFFSESAVYPWVLVPGGIYYMEYVGWGSGIWFAPLPPR